MDFFFAPLNLATSKGRILLLQIYVITLDGPSLSFTKVYVIVYIHAVLCIVELNLIDPASQSFMRMMSDMIDVQHLLGKLEFTSNGMILYSPIL